MTVLLLIAILCICITAFTFDMSFNLRRINNNLERISRKLSEISELVRG